MILYCQWAFIDNMFLLTFHVRPLPSSNHGSDEGACVSRYIDNENFDDAEKITLSEKEFRLEHIGPGIRFENRFN